MQLSQSEGVKVLIAALAVSLCFAQPDLNPIVGGSGWVGAGLLGLLLGWLLMVHLPNKDKQLKDMIDINARENKELLDQQVKERETERESRHRIANQFQAMITEITNKHEATVKEMNAQHRADAMADRDSFMQRNESITEAIRMQTEALKIEIRTGMTGSCRWFQQFETKKPDPPKSP